MYYIGKVVKDEYDLREYVDFHFKKQEDSYRDIRKENEKFIITYVPKKGYNNNIVEIFTLSIDANSFDGVKREVIEIPLNEWSPNRINAIVELEDYVRNNFLNVLSKNDDYFIETNKYEIIVSVYKNKKYDDINRVKHIWSLKTANKEGFIYEIEEPEKIKNVFELYDYINKNYIGSKIKNNDFTITIDNKSVVIKVKFENDTKEEHIYKLDENSEFGFKYDYINPLYYTY